MKIIIFSNKLDERAIESQEFYKSDSSDGEAPAPPDSIPTCSNILETVVLQTNVNEFTQSACEDIEFSANVGIATKIGTDMSVPVEEPVTAIEPIATVSLSTSSKMRSTKYTKNKLTAF